MKLGGTNILTALALLAGCTGVIDAPGDESGVNGNQPPAAGVGGGPTLGLGSGAGAPTGSGATTSTPLPPLPPGAPCRVAAPMRRLTATQYANAVRDVFQGKASLPADFALATVGKPESGFSTDPSYNAVDVAVARDLTTTAEAVAVSALPNLGSIAACAASAPTRACAETFIDQVGLRAFRRPLLSAERDQLLKVYALGTGADAFKDGIALVIATLLQSPQFLYQAEAGTAVPAEPGVLRLSPYEVASRLSFLLWDSIPDDALLQAAAAGRLATGAEVRAQAERMLGSEKARATIVRFAREWTHLEVPKPGVDRLDPAYKPALAQAMQTEFDSFVAKSFLSSGTSIRDFFTSNAAFGDATLNSFYGQSEGMGPRAGLLTQPALLTGIANPQGTSPIRRSVFVRRQLTCESFPNPPNDVESVESSLPAAADASARERSSARIANSKCAACHNLIDPLGFGFEAFDELGRYRTMGDNGAPIDARGELVAPVSPELAGPFTDLRELGVRLAESSSVHRCVTRQLFRFNYGRLDGSADTCAIDGVVERWGTGLELRDLLLAMVAADEFRFRRVQ